LKETREHILKTAFKLFLSKSYKEVTMKEIVEKTKMSKGAFYHYFPSKENLFIEIIDTYYFSMVDINYNQFSHDSLYDFIHQIYERLNGFISEMKNKLDFNEDMNFLNYYMIMFDALKHFPGFKEKINKVHRIEQESWEEIIRIAREKGEIKSAMNDSQIAKIFICISDGVGMDAIVYRRIDTIGKEVLTLWEKFYEEIKN
jgi:TetR/AcrR family transcriptional regulator, transcriptional repressor for nem operon